jgi:transposase-like protein
MQTCIISIKHLVSEAQGYETIRQPRWQEGVFCPHGDSQETLRRGFDGPERHLRRSECQACGRRFDDLTGTALSGHHQPLSTWRLGLYFMGRNLSNAQIAQELDLNKDDVQAMAEGRREGLSKKKTR